MPHSVAIGAFHQKCTNTASSTHNDALCLLNRSRRNRRNEAVALHAVNFTTTDLKQAHVDTQESMGNDHNARLELKFGSNKIALGEKK